MMGFTGQELPGAQVGLGEMGAGKAAGTEHSENANSLFLHLF